MAQWENIDAFLRSVGIELDTPTPGQTTGGGHTTGSLHFDGRARDYDLQNDCVAIAEALAPFAEGADFVIEELFFQSTDRGWFFDRGTELTPSASLRDGHRNHLHAGLGVGKLLPLSPGLAPALAPALSLTGVLMALSDDEQQELLETVRRLDGERQELLDTVKRIDNFAVFLLAQDNDIDLRGVSRTVKATGKRVRALVEQSGLADPVNPSD